MSAEAVTPSTALNELIHHYAQAKSTVGGQLGASEALLHVHAGLLVFVIVALLMRRRMASSFALVLVGILAVANEVADYLGPTPSAYSQSAIDVLNTLFWPSVLFCLARGRAAVAVRNRSS